MTATRPEQAYYIKWYDHTTDRAANAPHQLFYDVNDHPGQAAPGERPILRPVGGEGNEHYISWKGSFTDADNVFLVAQRAARLYGKGQPQYDSFDIHLATREGTRYLDKEGDEWLVCYTSRVPFSRWMRRDLKSLWGR